MWLCMEDSISETSVERVRMKEGRRGGARAFRPGDSQLDTN
jgi:hypothetical protein